MVFDMKKENDREKGEERERERASEWVKDTKSCMINLQKCHVCPSTHKKFIAQNFKENGTNQRINVYIFVAVPFFVILKLSTKMEYTIVIIHHENRRKPLKFNRFPFEHLTCQ